MVVVLAFGPVQDPDLGGAFYAAGGGLVDVDVGEGCVGGVLVLFYVEVDGGEADGFAG